jgi:hypothetical protein
VRVKITGYTDVDDEFADPDHASGLSGAGWDDVTDNNLQVGDLEELAIEVVK